MSKHNNDCYTDNLKVKISERYKPPPRINVAVPYAQRLTLNKQIEDNIPNYEFSLEKTVLNKMKEWRGIRAEIIQNRKIELKKAREDLIVEKEKQSEKEQVEEIELKTVNNIDTVASCSHLCASNVNQSYGNYTANNILVPTQITNQYTNILKPIPLQNNNSKSYSNQNDKSPFNIKDFENDTSSPFDNMELKSINDMEELAQVLNKGKSNYKANTNTQLYSNYTSERCNSTVQQPYINYIGSQYSYNIPNQTTNYSQQPVTDYSRVNGYYYNSNPFQTQYMYSKPSTTEFYSTISPETSDIKKSNCKSVPDIVKALENEIENTHISTSVPQDSYIKKEKAIQSSRPKSIDVYPRPKIKNEELEDPFFGLSKSQQDMCRSISLMGFPLERVARTCQLIGDDEKRVLDHLLALTYLLDLGFSEKDISSALIECNNDKEKALDKLIS